MPNVTEKYGLTKPLPEEFYDIAVHNENMDKIDEALGECANIPVSSEVPEDTNIWIDPSEDNVDCYTREETDFLLSGKAPAGYGLGQNLLQTLNPEQLAAWTKAGWAIYYDDNTPLVASSPASRAAFVLSMGQNASITGNKPQIAIFYEAGAIMVMRDRETSEWSYVTPPMYIGVEYRTTERYQGKPVYVKAVNTGALGQNAVDDVFVDTPNADNIWVASGTFINTSGGGATPTSIPYCASADDNIVFASAHRGVIHRVYKGSAYTITNMMVVLKYTKSTD